MVVSLVLLCSVIGFGLLTIYVLNLFVEARIKSRISLQDEAPLALGWLKGLLFFGGGMFLTPVTPSFQTLFKVFANNYSATQLLFKSSAYFSLFWGIALLVMLVVFSLSFLMFTLISKGKNLFVETANNNLGAVLIFGGILLTLTLIAQTALTPVFDALIPYPTLPMYR